jgi:hypothetical protein|tara:strand:+ start:828 stop:1037 length:210 start_codon:yes stop_codon:yes gene_type:complete
MELVSSILPQVHKELHNMITARLYKLAKAHQVEGKKMILELSDGQRFNVKGSREANKLCNELNAKPWNF